MARIPKQRVIFDAEKYDLDYLRETRDSYSPMTDAEFEDSISYDMGEDDLRDLMETDWRSNENALDAFLGKSILVRYSPVNYDDGFVQFNLNDLHDLLHAHTSPLHRVDKVWDEDGHLFLSGKWPDNSPLLVEVRKLTVEGERAMDAILTADRRGDFDAVRGTFHAMWDDPALVSTPRYAELALGMPAEDALAPLPLDHITFDDEIAENGDKLNFYIPVTFNCDAVFGTDVCSLDNDDYLNIYVDYDMLTGEVGNQLDISLNRADGRIDSRVPNRGSVRPRGVHGQRRLRSRRFLLETSPTQRRHRDRREGGLRARFAEGPRHGLGNRGTGGRRAGEPESRRQGVSCCVRGAGGTWGICRGPRT